MRKTLLPLFALAALLLVSCSNDNSDFLSTPGVVAPEEPTRSLFPEDDGAPRLSGTFAEQAQTLLAQVNVAECTDTMGRINITPEQYAEIKAFTDDLVAECTSQFAAARKCYTWVCENIKYDYTDNDPYPVFKNRTGICQGYSNLLFVMLHSQGIPSLITNGYLNSVGGHAWNYVYCADKWYVADATNKGFYSTSRIDDFKNTLMPYSFDAVLYKENGCWFDYNERQLNICKVESDESIFTVPFSVKGIRVTSFNPSIDLPSNIREVYIGKNIETLGENSVGLVNKAPGVEYIHVDPENESLASYLGAVYLKSGSDYQLYVIPQAMKCLEMMPVETIYKNTVYRHNGMEVVIIPPGTKYIEDWAFEFCPNLKIAYIPDGVSVAKNAFSGVHPDFVIIRGDYTNIPQIKED